MDSQQDIIRVAGRLKKVITLTDASGKVIQRFLQPFMVEFHPRDAMQVVVGATILAIPVAFTEETWMLAEEMPLFSTLGFLALSLAFISAFVFYNYYRRHFSQHRKEFFKRVSATYGFSFLIVSVILMLIGQAPWLVDPLLAFKRSVLVAFPASLSGAISDVIK